MSKTLTDKITNAGKLSPYESVVRTEDLKRSIEQLKRIFDLPSASRLIDEIMGGELT